ncbi:MAG: TolC family protein, partial [Gemmatimonadetes bacterium]|nr:TolC family protein [Gemmatimonadota bacterium]
MNQIWPSSSRSGRGVLVAAASIAVLVAPGLAGAETYDLATCTSLALKNTLTAEQARTNLQSAEAGVTGARSGFLPRLSVSGSWTKPEATTEQIGGEFVVFDNSYWSGGANASWTLFDGLGTWNSWKSARYGRDAAEES